MAVRSQVELRSLLKRIEKAVAVRKSKTPDLAVYTNQFFSTAAVEDLLAFSDDDLAFIADNSLGFLKDRMRGRHKVRVFNPKTVSARDGQPFTVLEIVNDDMPFLVESVLGELAERGLEVQLLMHPIIMVARGPRGNLKHVLAEGEPTGGEGLRESVIHAHIEYIANSAMRKELEAKFVRILDDTRTVVLDWRSMRTRLDQAVTDYQQTPPPVPVDELAETIQFLQWLGQDHFTLLGMREFTYVGDETSGELVEVEGSDLGLMRDPDLKVLRRGREMVTLTPEVREFLMQPAPLIITKANIKSHVHRRTYMDYVGIKQFDAGGALKGELRVVGLFTSAAYTRSVRAIPFLRRKADLVLRLAGFEPSTHSGRALVNILESYPRDELFQIDIDTLVEIALDIQRLTERPRTRVFVRKDKFDRFVSALVYVPRDAYDTEVRKKIGVILCAHYAGRVSAFYPAYPEGTMARVHFIIGSSQGAFPDVDHEALERDIAVAARNWSDNFHSELKARLSPKRAARIFDTYGTGFPKIYEDTFAPQAGIIDAEKMESLATGSALAPNLWEGGSSEGRLNFRLYHMNAPIALTDRLPILQNMGFRAINERSFEINRKAGGGHECVWLHEIFLALESGGPINFKTAKPLVEEAFLAIWNGKAEDDGYNRLILQINCGWREISVLRGVGKFLQQAGIPFSQDYLAATLYRHHELAKLMLDLFAVRFDPAFSADNDGRDKEATAIVDKIIAGLDAVTVLDEDRIIRRFVNVLQSMLRTNYYQRGKDGAFRPAIAYKLASSKIEGLPKPHPLVEIFVYSPRIEGVHLRFGKIARGGLRWSDRPQDFRTEVLGLVKAQQVKNAVIVPVGSKGGFFPKHLRADMSREDFIAEGIAAYKIFIGSMLDITDNLSGSRVRPPKDVVRRDSDDPYLVVAADKGTATFSDIANGISVERGFWLGDAFASGGSAGYDHKKMGITARGGWEAVKRHFREVDRDIQSEPFTVIGCGDMSGDVFGNGMLLSKQTKLIAAFDHRDIFIDPDPDPKTSYAERRRLFRRDRSSWKDYKPSLISKGGGVFSRSAKSIRLTAEIKRLTGLAQDSVPPAELISALLKAEVDLLWFGGIGTYIRASDETDAQVGDRANDALRITASQLRAKVIGEGANLGITQAARIEFAKNGGRINTDAIDNSAGVNSSDMEVNIKIALSGAVKDGRLTPKARNTFLATMTDQVAAQVLANNYEQTLCISLAESRGATALEFQIRLMKTLEGRELLDRNVEGLPDDVELAERQSRGEGLTRPEHAVLLAWAKIALFNDLVAGPVPDDAYFVSELISYFPPKMRQPYDADIKTHRLKREIVATVLSNSLINLGGSTMMQRMADETGAGIAAITSAFALARDAFCVADLIAEIDALDNKIANVVQYRLYVGVQNLIRRQTVWFLRSIDAESDLGGQVARFRGGIAATAAAIRKTMDAERRAAYKAETASLVDAGVPRALAQRLALLSDLARAPDIVQVAEDTGRDITDVTRAFFEFGEALGIERLLELSDEVVSGGFYDRLALNRTMEQVSAAQRRFAASALSAPGKNASVAGWLRKNRHAVKNTRSSIDELVSTGGVTLAKLAVASAYLTDLAGR
ncbi:NAD-specific glutamate dehydrogenase, large form [hydrothermal vent metagenome]|uniref:NAD-specific glutamate dehydrogenase, large form n=1 Tax=hydrothermal vent metagenome TaxID=652676 RepID=A0A3B0TWE9_9ZZZZ